MVFTICQTGTKINSKYAYITCKLRKNYRLTFTRAVRTTEYRTLFYSAERCEQLAHILLGLLFAQHTNEQLPICGKSGILVVQLHTVHLS